MAAVEQLSPGLILEFTVEPRVALALRVTRHSGATLAPLDDRWVLRSRDGRSRWFALYGPAVLANRWEPFNQPIAAAYVPLAFDAMDGVPCDPRHALFVQRRARLEPASRYLRRPDGGEVVILAAPDAPRLHAAVNQVLGRAALPAAVHARACAAVVASCRGWLPEAAAQPATLPAVLPAAPARVTTSDLSAQPAVPARPPASQPAENQSSLA